MAVVEKNDKYEKIWITMAIMTELSALTGQKLILFQYFLYKC